MAGNYWVKIYIEILDDSKVMTMPYQLRWRMIELFLLAGRYNDDGNLPDTNEIAWALRCTTDEIALDLKQLANVGIIRKTETGWFVVNFAKRQERMTDAERMRQYRERRQHEQYTDATVTNPVTRSLRNVTQITDNRLTETEAEENPPSPPSVQIQQKRPNIFTLYEQTVGIITQPMADKLIEAERTYPEDWIAWAFNQADSNNKRSWSYVEACLKNRANGQSIGPRPGGNGKHAPSTRRKANEVDSREARARYAMYEQERIDNQ